jgi:hypothetical protein
MEIDIDSLSEAELIALNHKIVERIKIIRQMKTHHKMMDFAIGQRVSFNSPSGQVITGLITRYNKKTVTIMGENGDRWNVSPGFLRPAEQSKSKKPFGFQV